MTVAVRNRLLVGDALDRLRELSTSSIDMALTSPPYFRLRNYDAEGQIGLEGHVDQWVEQLAAVADEVRRVLVPTGTYWLNLGDTYSTHSSQGASRKSLVMAPERLALRLQRSGWIVRNKIIWAKPNPLPTSIRDRLNTTYELVYVLAKNPSYFFDLDAIRVPHRSALAHSHRTTAKKVQKWRGPNAAGVGGLARLHRDGIPGHPLGKNPGDVWWIAPAGYKGAHHAVFPLSLATTAIQAGCPELRCSTCRLPWRRKIIRSLGGTARRTAAGPTCHCDAASEPGIVLDPFMGSGTTAVAAEELSRDWLGVELNPDFAELANQRIDAARLQRQQGQQREARAGPRKSAA